MKIIVALLASALSLTTACTTDEIERSGAPGLRPGYKPPLEHSLDSNKLPDDDRAEIEDVLDGGDLDARDLGPGSWVEEIELDGRPLTVLHGRNGREVVLDGSGKLVEDPRL